MTRPARVHQILATLGYGDAIGNEVLGIRRVLRQAGCDSEIFVETADPRLEDQTVDYRDLIGDCGPDDVLIHHFSIGSRASRVAYALPAKMILVYHNITPPEYFLGVNLLLVQLCHNGRRELRAYRSRCHLALGDSVFNQQELDEIGFPATGVLPVVPDFSHLQVQPNRLLAGQFDDDWINILFVGRVIPNKRFEDLIAIFHAYKSGFNLRSRLLLVGAYSGFEAYLTMLHHQIATLGLADVHFLGHVSNEELTAYYDVADLFLCASQHEGFCVPLIEAFHKRVPVLAYRATAVPATMMNGGVLYDSADPVEVAATMDAILGDPDVTEAVLASQDQALDRLRRQDFAGTLLGFVERVRSEPRLASHRVAPDFWQQFDAAERLEALRLERPSAFKALPQPRRGTPPPGGDPPDKASPR